MPRRPAGSQPRRTRITSLHRILSYTRPISRGPKSRIVLHFGPLYLPGPFKEERACASNIDGSRFPRGSFGARWSSAEPFTGRTVLTGSPSVIHSPRRLRRKRQAPKKRPRPTRRRPSRLPTDRSKSPKVPPVRRASRRRLSSTSRRSPNRRSRIRQRHASWSSEPKARVPSCIPTRRPGQLSLRLKWPTPRRFTPRSRRRRP